MNYQELKKKFGHYWARGVSGHENGLEYPDPTPVEVPVGFKPPLSLAEEVARLVHNQKLQSDLSAAGADTFEEADDFDIPDEDMSSPWEDEHVGRAFNRENEIRAGIVDEPDYERAKQLVSKANKFIAEYEAKRAAEANKQPAAAAGTQ